MTDILVQFIPLAVAAIAPALILVVILLLSTKNGLTKALAFTSAKYLVYLGWGTALFVVSGEINNAGDSETPVAVAAIKLLLGVLLLVFAGKSFLGEDDPDAVPPKWMTAVEKAGAGTLLWIGALLSLIQIRFVLLMAAGVSIMMATGLASRQAIVLLLILALCMVWPLIIPIVAYLLMGERAASALDSMSKWLVKNQRWVNAAVLLLFGILLLSSGLTELDVIGS